MKDRSRSSRGRPALAGRWEGNRCLSPVYVEYTYVGFRWLWHLTATWSGSQGIKEFGSEFWQWAGLPGQAPFPMPEIEKSPWRP